MRVLILFLDMVHAFGYGWAHLNWSLSTSSISYNNHTYIKRLSWPTFLVWIVVRAGHACTCLEISDLPNGVVSHQSVEHFIIQKAQSNAVNTHHPPYFFSDSRRHLPQSTRHPPANPTEHIPNLWQLMFPPFFRPCWSIFWMVNNCNCPHPG